MDFDEYDYLEKTVDEPGSHRNGSSSKPTTDEKNEKGGYRRREREEDDDDVEDERIVGEEEERKSKRSKGDEENGGSRRDRDRERGDRDRERSSRSERHRSSGRDDGDRERERERERRRSSRDGERSSKDRERERGSRDKDKDRRGRRRGKERRGRGREKGRRRERGRGGAVAIRGLNVNGNARRSYGVFAHTNELTMRKLLHGFTEESAFPQIEFHKIWVTLPSTRPRQMSILIFNLMQEDIISEISYYMSACFMAESMKILDIFMRLKDKKEVVEPEADPERDQRTVFAYQMPLKATEWDVYEFFSKAGKVRDVRLIMDRNSRRSKGVGYIEFYDAMSVPMAIALSGHLLLGQPVMVKPSEAEKNLVQSNASTGGAGGIAGPYGAVDRKLYVGNLHFNMTELQLKQIFEAFGPVELVQLPTDPETGHCKGFGFVQFSQLEHAKAAQSLNGKLEIAGRTIKVSSVTDHVGAQDTGAKAADFDDDDGGGLALNAQSRAMLMAKLDRSGIASSVPGALGVGAPLVNGSAPIQAGALPINGPSTVPVPGLAQMVSSIASEPVGNPSECLLLKNMFDPASEVDPEFDLDIKDDVQEECSNYGRVKHIHVDKHSAGYVYLRFDSVEGAARAQQAMHKRWFARRLISAIFLQPYEYDAKFKGTA
ncbi:hypothetical protein OSB04_027557 [Centaurea solstitialis]|uniref:RRM domain-containing protein n=1 Tax=Centaurea solstitialis TaxID=347529 RepID=A0AA38SSD1_9ASTR|nr:hypothetical protein OSB04_027557 [Centaurea solstitialis]